jgi:hypothetical protein
MHANFISKPTRAITCQNQGKHKAKQHLFPIAKKSFSEMSLEGNLVMGTQHGEAKLKRLETMAHVREAYLGI